MTPASSTSYRRAGWFTILLLLISVVVDGFSGRPSELMHQVLLLPITVIFLVSTWRFLAGRDLAHRDLANRDLTDQDVAYQELAGHFPGWTPTTAIRITLIFELTAAAVFFFQGEHFALLGYRLHLYPSVAFFSAAVLALIWLSFKPASPGHLLFAAMAAYAGGLTLAILSFPLNYLRSDMLPVIVWADTNLLHHVSPYATMYVGGRVYDFPYLPGMLVAFLPFLAAHLDIRFGSMAFLCAAAGLIYWAAHTDRRREVAALVALFILCPFLQYRHDLYLQPHWFALVLAFVLMQRRRFAWAAIVFGASMAIYQFSWILFPFFALNAFRRRGWLEALKLTALAGLGAGAIAGPFLASAYERVSSNTVGQWGRMPHALAEPMNLSYWLTYLVRPDKLLRVQAAVMVAIFAFCVFRGRCRDLADTLRWMIAALTLFIMLNVIVDGYFYLMLLVPMLVYTCVANGWWADPADPVPA